MIEESFMSATNASFFEEDTVYGRCAKSSSIRYAPCASCASTWVRQGRVEELSVNALQRRLRCEKVEDSPRTRRRLVTLECVCTVSGDKANRTKRYSTNNQTHTSHLMLRALRVSGGNFPRRNLRCVSLPREQRALPSKLKEIKKELLQIGGG